MKRLLTAAINDDKALSWDDQRQWLMDNLGFTYDDASDAVSYLDYFTDRGYCGIHNRDFDDYCQINRRAERIIDKVLLHPNMPKYSGKLYRGIVWPRYDAGSNIEAILDSGVWEEPGITSFTSSIDIAKTFAFTMCDSLHDPVLITMLNNKHACEIGFLSQGGGEEEYLYPSLIADRGLKIVDWSKEDHWSERISRKTGKPRLIHTDYYITVRDW